MNTETVLSSDGAQAVKSEQPLANAFELVDFCSGQGQLHTDSPSAFNPRPLDSVTWSDVLDMIQHPKAVQKSEGPWAIFSTLKSRVFERQRKEGSFFIAWSDLDENPPGVSPAVLGAAEAIKADTYGYSSRSATQDTPKCRLLFPLAEPIDGQRYEWLQECINDRLEAAGLTPDRVTERAAQLCYLPNRGDLYEHDVVDILGPLDWKAEFGDELAAKENAHNLEQAALELARAQWEKNRKHREAQYTGGQISPIATFRDNYSSREAWLVFGGAREHGKRCLSPYSSSGSAAITFTDDGTIWCSHHGSDVQAGVGTPSEGKGSCWGDGFDVFVHFKHGGDFNAALKAAGEMFKTPAGDTITKHNQRAHMEEQARIEAAQEFEGAGDWWGDVGDSSQSGGQEAPENAQEGEATGTPGEDTPAPPSLLERLDRYKARHLLATTPPPQRYVVEGMIPEPITAAIVAPGSTGKSFWLMQLAACVANGTPFMGQAIPEPGAVLMLGAEDDRDEMARRLHSIVTEYALVDAFGGHTLGDVGLDPKLVGERFYAVSRLGESNLLTHMDGRNIVRMDGKNGRPDNIGEIIKAAQAIPDLRLIIIDPISRFRAGDENDNEAATRFVEALEQIRKETGVTVLCAHHSRKGSDGKDADGIRGASALVDAFRFAATLAKVPHQDAKKMRLSEDEAKNLVQFNVVKSNYRTDLDSQWLYRGMGGVLKVTEPPMGLKDGPVDDKGEERYSAILPKLKELVRTKDADGKPLTRRKLREEYGGTTNTFGVGKGTLEDIANRAITEGVLKLHEDTNTLHLW